jgi:hypothetical protein
MEITTFKHERVKRDGTFEDRPGAVETDGAVLRSQPGGGCDLSGCHCSDGHWITIVAPRDSYGIVTGITVKFDDQKEMDKFLKP